MRRHAKYDLSGLIWLLILFYAILTVIYVAIQIVLNSPIIRNLLGI